MAFVRRSSRSVAKKDYNQEIYQKELNIILEEDRVQQLLDAGVCQMRSPIASSQTLPAMSTPPPSSSLGNEFILEKTSTPTPTRSNSVIPMSSPTTSPLRSQTRSRIRAQHAKSEQKLKSKKKKPLNFCGPQTFVTIKTGKKPDQQAFTLHKSLLLHHSSYFRLAFNNPNLVESQTQTLTLPEIDSSLFSIIVNWFYHQKILPPLPIPSTSSQTSHQQTQETETHKLPQLTLLKLHTLASTLTLPTLQNQILHTLNAYEFTGSLESCIEEWKDVAAYSFGEEMRGSALREKVLEDLFDVFLFMEDEGTRMRFLRGVFGEAAWGVLGMLLGREKFGVEGEGRGVERFLVGEEDGED